MPSHLPFCVGGFLSRVEQGCLGIPHSSEGLPKPFRFSIYAGQSQHAAFLESLLESMAFAQTLDMLRLLVLHMRDSFAIMALRVCRCQRGAAFVLQNNPATSLASLMAAVADARTLETLGPLVLHVREGQHFELSVQQVQKMTWQELARIWKVGSIFPNIWTFTSWGATHPPT